MAICSNTRLGAYEVKQHSAKLFYYTLRKSAICNSNQIVLIIRNLKKKNKSQVVVIKRKNSILKSTLKTIIRLTIEFFIFFPKKLTLNIIVLFAIFDARHIYDFFLGFCLFSSRF